LVAGGSTCEAHPDLPRGFLSDRADEIALLIGGR
jgi:hypothetical protein